ncbi:GNAT family N-acetyltransferase [bacterium]|nr:GNAT family N-acetyltransferase [bacterium]
MRVIEFRLEDKTLLRDFVEFPFKLYQGEKQWVPKLKMDYLGASLLGKVGMFEEKFPFHQDAETVFLMVKQEDQVLATMTVSINHAYNKYQQQKVGFFGFFECVNNAEVAQQLFDHAKAWLKTKGVLSFIGPYNFTYNHTCGVLVKGFDLSPYIEMTYNFDYYDNLLHSVGLEKAKDLLSFYVPVEEQSREARYSKLAQRILKRNQISIRPVSLKNFKQDIRTFVDIYNEAWEDLWTFVPLSEEEADIIADSIKPIIIPEMFLFAEKEGVPIGVSGLIPNANELLKVEQGYFGQSDIYRVLNLLFKKKSIKSARLMAFGVRKKFRKKGLEAALLSHAQQKLSGCGFSACEVGWVHEDNQLILGTIESSKGVHYKTHRIYTGSC